MSVLVCPRPDELAGFRDGTLVLDRHLGVAKHLKGCKDCRARVAALPTPADNTPTDDQTNPGPLAVTVETDLEEVAPAPTIVGPYRLGPVIGRGGMGVVYQGTHIELGQKVAVKVLPRPAPSDPEAAARFRREWMALGRLSHPNVVRALHAGTAGDVPFLAMELVSGADLGKVVQRCGPLAVADAAAVARFAALGLAHAHALGVTHRDVKPGNILLTAGGEVKLLDLGLAQLAGVGAVSSVRLPAGAFVGTADYMSPEQWDDPASADSRADIYALGCVLFYLLTGKPPFAAPDYRTPLDKKRAHLTAEPPAPDAPNGLLTVLKWMLRKDPIDRPHSAALVADALAPYAVGARLGRLAAAADRDAVGAFADGPQTNPMDSAPTTGGPPVEAATRAAPVRRRAPRLWWLLAGVPVGLLVAGGLAAMVRPAKPTVTPIPTAAVTEPPVAPTDVDPGEDDFEQIPEADEPLPAGPAAPAVKPPLAPIAALVGGRPANALAFATDSKGLYVGHSDGEVVRWDAADWTSAVVFTLPPNNRGPAAVRAVAPIGATGQLLVGGHSRVYLLDPAGKPVKTVRVPGAVWSLAVGADGRGFAVGHASTDGPDPVPAVTTWELASGLMTGRWDGPAGRKQWVRATPAAWLAADDRGEVLRINPAKPAEPVRVPATAPKFHTIGLSAAGPGPLLLGDVPAARGLKDAAACTLDAHTAAVSKVVTARGLGAMRTAAVAPDGKTAVLGSGRGHLFVGDPAGGRYDPVPFAHPGGVTLSAVSPDGRLVATAGEDGLVRVWAMPAP